MDWQALGPVWPIILGIVIATLASWLRERLPTRGQKQEWWETEVKGLREANTLMRTEVADLRARIAVLERERDEALVKRATAIIERDNALILLKSQAT
jgi:hypothetical protein